MQDEKYEDAEKNTFEEALSKAGFGGYSHNLMCLAGVAIVSFTCIYSSSTIVIPVIACDLHTNSAQQGLLVAGPIVGCILGATVWGYWADQYGRRRILIISLLMGAGFNAVSSLSVDWVMLLILQFIASLMISGQYSLAMTLLSESVPMDRRNLVVIMVTSISFLSQGIMAVIAIPIIPLSFSIYLPYLDINWSSWRLLLLIYSLPSVGTVCWLYFMQESPKFVYSQGREQDALQILKIIYVTNNKSTLHEYPVKWLMRRRPHPEGPVSRINHIVPLFRAPLLKYTIIMSLLFILEQIGAFMMWLPTLANRFTQGFDNGGLNLTLCDIIASSISNSEDVDSSGTCALDSSALLIVLVVGLISSVTNSAASLLVRRVGRRNMAILVTAVTGLSGVLVNLVPNVVASAALFALELMGVVAIGLYTAMCVALFPTYLRALAVTVTMTGGRIASFITIQVINYLFANNCEVAFYVYGSALAFSAVIASFLPNDHRTRTSQHDTLAEQVADDSVDSF